MADQVGLCPKCGARRCIIRSNGRSLPACSDCWGDGAPIGERSINARGYARVKTETGWRFEHVVVAERILGRRLRNDERVSWVDGDKANNDPANLLVGVTRFKPLLEAPQRARNRTGEKHRDRVEVRVGDMLPELHALAIRRHQTVAQTAAAMIARSLREGWGH